MAMFMDDKAAGYYGYDGNGERVYKLTGYTYKDNYNAGADTTHIHFNDVVLYANPYFIVTPKGYTKHYYNGSQRLASVVGDIEELPDEIIGNTSTTKSKEYLQTFANNDTLVNVNVDYEKDLLYPVLGKVVSNHSDHDLNDNTYYYHGDHLGSMSWITDGFGDIIEHRTYLPYGEEWYSYRAIKKYTERFTFTGKEKDAESGYDYFGARYFDAMLLTSWLSPDPIIKGHENPYLYCSGNPMRILDPTGMDTVNINYNTQNNKWDISKPIIAKGDDVFNVTDKNGNTTSHTFSEGDYGNRISSLRLEDNGSQTLGAFLLSGEGSAGFFVEPTGTPSNSGTGTPTECGIFDIGKCNGPKWTGWPEQYNDGVQAGRGVCIHFCWSKSKEAKGLGQSGLSAKEWTSKCMVVSSAYSQRGGVVLFDGNQSRSMARRVARYCGVTSFIPRSGKYESCSWGNNNGVKRIVKSTY